MKKSRFTETQMILILKQADAGVPVKAICRQSGISMATYYQWKPRYGGMEASDLKREAVRYLVEVRAWSLRCDCVVASHEAMAQGIPAAWGKPTERLCEGCGPMML